MTQLMEYVRALEGKNNQTRGEEVLAALGALEIEPTVQKCRWPRIRNIIVDFLPGPEAKRLVFSAHYDAAKGSPGANDNASGVAVLLGLCHEIRDTRTPIRVIFFDREEPWLETPVIRLGLLGSLYYVWKSDLWNTAAVYNLDFCGMGDFLGIWSIKGDQANLPVVQEVERAATKLNLPFKPVYIPRLLMGSDDIPFRVRGVSNAVTLTLFPANQVPVVVDLLANLSIKKLLIGRRPVFPEPLSFFHTSKDVSSRLNENSLGVMLSLLLELIRGVN